MNGGSGSVGEIETGGNHSKCWWQKRDDGDRRVACAVGVFVTFVTLDSCIRFVSRMARSPLAVKRINTVIFIRVSFNADRVNVIINSSSPIIFTL